MFNVTHISLNMGTGGGGLEAIIVNLVNELNREFFKVTVGCLDYGGGLLDQIHAAGFESFVTGRRPGFDWRLILQLRSLFVERNTHIVHTHNQAAHFYAGLAARLAKVPILITTEHSRHNTEGNRVRQLEKRALCAITNKWIVVSDELAKQSIKYDGLPPKHIKVIRNGVNFQKYHDDTSSARNKAENLRKQLGLPQKAKVIIMVARLHPIKNHDLFLDSFSDVITTIPDVHAVFVGDGECRASLEKQCKELQLQDYVHFLGYREDVAELLQISDVFVLCSKTEGLPVSLLEACAAGVPVLITKNSNKAGLINDGESGTVVEGETKGIAKGLCEIFKNNSQVKSMARVVAEHVRSEYSLSAMANQYESLYFDLLLEKGFLNENIHVKG